MHPLYTPCADKTPIDTDHGAAPRAVQSCAQEDREMITLDDIEDMTDLTREEIDAVAEHEHLPDLNAAVLADKMMHMHHGPQKVQQMICEDIRTALHRGNLPHARELFVVLHHFIADHPDAAQGAEG